MKLNWGTGIVIAFVIFAALLTVAMVLGSQQRVDLVTPDYYEQEIRFQDRIDYRENAKELGEIDVVVTGNDVTIIFPSALDPSSVRGKASFYKPDNANFDFQVELNVDSNHEMKVNREERIGGLWTLMIEAEQSGKSYYWEEKIQM